MMLKVRCLKCKDVLEAFRGEDHKCSCNLTTIHSGDVVYSSVGCVVLTGGDNLCAYSQKPQETIIREGEIRL